MAKKPILEFELDTFSGVFRAESDRACAVLGAALLDSRLESLYSRRLLSVKPDLLSNNGAIGTFSARISLARALAWISEDVQHDLDKIRSIRNEFAHNFDHELSFSSPPIAEKCQVLRVAQVLIDANEYAASIPHPNFSAGAIRAMGDVFRSPRQRFEVTVEMLAQHIDELSAYTSEYQGPNLRNELWELASRVRVKFSGSSSPVSPSAKN